MQLLRVWYFGLQLLSSSTGLRVNMSDYKTRLIAEVEDIKDKLDRLQKALSNQSLKDIVGDEHYFLMVKQERIMDAYVGVLAARIHLSI
jgi:uncharacterized protein YPO0396